jgi:hypothetical protein
MSDASIETFRRAVDPSDCDFLGHMNVSRYFQACSDAMFSLQAGLGMTRTDMAQTGRRLSFAVVHAESDFLREVMAGDTSTCAPMWKRSARNPPRSATVSSAPMMRDGLHHAVQDGLSRPGGAQGRADPRRHPRRAGGHDGGPSMRLEGKTAIVTGGGSGFGAGIARIFAGRARTVMVADINAGAARVAPRSAASRRHVDVSDGASVAAMTKAALDGWGRIDILVNNAGITHLPAPMEEVSEEDFDRVLAVNVKSVYLTAREIVPHMKAAGTRARSSTSPPPQGFPPGPGSTGTMPPRAG